MSYISSTSRNQLMLPISIDDYVSSANIVRFIDAFVDKVIKVYSLLERGQSSQGRPSYSSGCLCKLLIYGYLNSISSSRKLENETKRNLEVIWLMHNLHPDHWTISNFRKENKELIKKITIEFRVFLKDSDYIKGKEISTDGTKIKAYASGSTLSLKLIDKKLSEAEKEIERYLSQLNETDALEDEQQSMLSCSESLKEQIESLQKQVEELQSQKSLLECSGLDSLAPADPQAKVMKTKDGFLPAYNVQTTVDNSSHLITGCQVTDHPNDFHSLEENIKRVKEELNIVPNTCLADAGYANEEQIQLLEEQGVECIIPFPQESEIKKEQRALGITFSYDSQKDCFTCSQGKILRLRERNCKKKNHLFNKYQCTQCTQCPLKEHCTKSKIGRIIYQRVDGQWLDKHKEKSKTKDFKGKFKKRKCVVEHPFGTMKYYMGQIPLLLRGKEKVQIEMNLYSTAYNLTRLKSLDSVQTLLEKLKEWKPRPCLSDFLNAILPFWREDVCFSNKMRQLRVISYSIYTIF